MENLRTLGTVAEIIRAILPYTGENASWSDKAAKEARAWLALVEGVEPSAWNGEARSRIDCLRVECGLSMLRTFNRYGLQHTRDCYSEMAEWADEVKAVRLATLLRNELQDLAETV